MIKREIYLKRIRPFYGSEMVKVITGIRRCGKSTIMRQIIEEIQENGVEEDHIIYINFEDYKYRKICNPDALYGYVEENIRDNQKYYLFFDEIQNVDEFELVINSFRATHDASIFITGSNSKLLSGELATHLSGRTLSFKVLPFNFQEFCELKKSEGDNRTYDEYMQEFLNCASLSDSGQSVSAPTVYDYLKFIADACVCDKVPRYDIRGKKALAFEEKTYVCDLGFFHLKKNRVKDEYNYMMETLCYNELVSRGYQVYVGKTYKGEIDFIATRGDEKIYVQAAYLLTDEAVVEREFGAYRVVQDNYPKYVISMDKIVSSREGIIHMNVIDFCLNGFKG